ncbi:MAG: SBBP repeat-containing protein [Promethearchaeota archaeon]
MKIIKKITFSLISIGIILGIGFYNTAIFIPTLNYTSKELINPQASIIDPFLYENYITIGGSYIASATQTELDSSNNIYVTGQIRINDTEDTDAFLAKFDNNGEILWYNIWGGDYDDSGGGIAFDSAGNVYMGGSTSSFGPAVPNANWFLAKFDSAGNQLWNNSWGTTEGEWGGSIAVDSSDYIYYIGSTWGYSVPGGSADVGLVKFSSAGVIQWTRIWGPTGYDSPRDIEIDSSNNIYIVAGSDTRGIGGRDVALIKYDSAGNLQWDTAWGGLNFDDPRALALDDSGNIYIIGYTDSFGAGDYDIFITKYDSTPTQLWNTTWGGVNSDLPGDLALDAANNLYIGGNTESFGSGSSDIVYLKYDSSGNQQWNTTWGGINLEEGYGICIDTSNNTYIAGQTNSFNAINSNVLILKYNGTGQEEWFKTWDGESRDECYGIAFDSLNNYYITGFTEVYGKGGRDVILIKYDNSGIQQWNVTWGGSGSEEPRRVAVDIYNDIYVTGFTYSYDPGSQYAFLLKYDLSGNLLWNITWGGPYDDSGGGLAFDSIGNVYMGGSTSSFGPAVPNANWFLAKFDSAGNQLWNYSWGTNEGEWGGAIATDSVGNIYYTGSTWGHGGSSANVGLIKFNSSGVIQWARYWGPPGYDSPRDLIVDSSDFIYIIAGSDTRGFGGRDVALIKYNSAGTLQWDTAWGGSGFDEPSSITVDNLNNVYVVGRTDSFGEGGYDVMTLIFNSSGSLKWSKLFGGLSNDQAQVVKLDSFNKIFIGGVTESFATGTGDMLLLKYEIDLISPIITINSPIANEFFGVSAPDFDLTITETNIHSCWYSLDGGLNYSFIGSSGQINQTEWDKKGEGSFNINFYVLDMAGFETSSNIIVRKDLTSPISVISFTPYSGTNKVIKDTEFTITANDGAGSGVSLIRYKVNNSAWITYTGSFNFSSYSDGYYEITYQAIDTVNNVETEKSILVQLITPSVEEPEIAGYNFLIVISLIGITTLIIARKKSKSKI